MSKKPEYPATFGPSMTEKGKVATEKRETEPQISHEEYFRQRSAILRKMESNRDELKRVIKEAKEKQIEEEFFKDLEKPAQDLLLNVRRYLKNEQPEVEATLTRNKEWLEKVQKGEALTLDEKELEEKIDKAETYLKDINVFLEETRK
ncbi:MAG TPA: hypothetical protein VGA49_02175 [Patescibacteria group bacterium]